MLAAMVLPVSWLNGVHKFILVNTCGCYCSLPLPNGAVSWSAVYDLALPGHIRLYLFKRFALTVISYLIYHWLEVSR